MKLHTEIKVDAAHNLPNYNGKCRNLHGHTWKIVVEIECNKLDKNDFVVDFTQIKKVVNQFDHGYINKTIKNPTAENMSIYLSKEIGKLGAVGDLNRFKSVMIKVYEAENSYAENIIKF